MAKKNKDKYESRITIVMSKELYNRFDKYFVWGERNRVMLRLIEWAVEKLEKYGPDALYLFLRDGDLNKLLTLGEQAGTVEVKETKETKEEENENA